MRTFTLLTAIVLVALQAKAEPVPPTDDVVPDQEQSEAGDQVMVISFAGEEMSALQDPHQLRGLVCHCRRSYFPQEHIYGTCNENGTMDSLCCFQDSRKQK
uniref:Alpha-defensin N-terminal domain-containing protein n=1 Tax=Oryctolagus cuniculus TaxID=9986 RepID=A0A5F9CXZ0_RABIT|nr:defensin-7-like [Oryctolagus cuniculus]